MNELLFLNVIFLKNMLPTGVERIYEKIQTDLNKGINSCGNRQMFPFHENNQLLTRMVFAR